MAAPCGRMELGRGCCVAFRDPGPRFAVGWRAICRTRWLFRSPSTARRRREQWDVVNSARHGAQRAAPEGVELRRVDPRGGATGSRDEGLLRFEPGADIDCMELAITRCILWIPPPTFAGTSFAGMTKFNSHAFARHACGSLQPPRKRGAGIHHCGQPESRSAPCAAARNVPVCSRVVGWAAEGAVIASFGTRERVMAKRGIEGLVDEPKHCPTGCD